MVDTQHFCLRWNNYQSSITSAFENLRDDEDFVDVTLACEGKSLKAHRVVLSACSPYFRELLKSTPCKHPVIVLQDVAFADLHALVEFIYHGEVNVHQRSLTSFLKTAEVLRVSGLTQQAEEREEIPPSVTRNHQQSFSEKIDDGMFPSPITASAVGGLRRPAVRRDSEQAGLGATGGGEFDLSVLSKRAKCDDGHNSVVAAAASMLQQAAVAAAAAAVNQVCEQQSTPEDFSPKSRRNNGGEISENNHHHHHHHAENHDRRSDRSSPGEDVKSEPIESCPNIEVDNDDSVDGRDRSSVASGQDETDSSAQGPPPGHFHPGSVQDKLQSLFSAGSSPSQPAFNFNLPVSRQALSEAASLSGLANAAGLGNQGDLSMGSQGGGEGAGKHEVVEGGSHDGALPDPPLLPPPTPPQVPTQTQAPPQQQVQVATSASPSTPTSAASWGAGGKFSCEVCGKVLGTKLTLKRHKEQQHLQPLHSAVCPVCYKVFRTLNSLNNHRSIYHRRQRTEPPPNRAAI